MRAFQNLQVIDMVDWFHIQKNHGRLWGIGSGEDEM